MSGLARRLCVDIDNVVAQTDEVMRRVIRDVTEGSVDLQYEDIRTFNYWDCKDASGRSITRAQWLQVHDEFSRGENVLAIKPMSDVQRHLLELSDNFLIHFATSRLPKARKPTIEWLEGNGFDFRYDLHFIQHGEKHSTLGRFLASVEDDPKQAAAFASSPHKTVSFLLAHPWNELDGSPATGDLRRRDSWREIQRELLELAQA